MSNRKDLQQRFLETAARSFGLPVSGIHLGSSRKNTPQWDSLAHLKLFLALENEFEVRFPLEGLLEYDTLDRVFKTLQKKVPNESAR